MRLRDIPPETYARDVLPLTAPLWSGNRSFDEYVSETLAFARSRYGRRHFRTIGLYDGGRLLASFKQYERTLRDGSRRFSAIGFGAVFTAEELRGRGYASVMLALALDRARAAGTGIGFLFSDIHPQFYAALGFEALPSRAFSLSADALPKTRLSLARLTDAGWNDARRVFDACEKDRAAGFLRDAAFWRWIAERSRRGGDANFVVRRRGRIVAYVLGNREPDRDAFILEEFGFADDAAAAEIPALLRAAAGDLRRVIGWLPPEHARAALPKLAVRKRARAILMMAPLASGAERLIATLAAEKRGDPSWPTDHI
ncbi:MAG TPA: GNAT family N-acetyltransferase [Candidatus Nitrosotalea sp.]|nr:GNAT family N-acetyltransferase [Candidatus Nitrosotalea sp.]